MSLEKYLFLNTRKLLFIIGGMIVAILIHNILFGVFIFEEELFFIAIIAIIVYFFIAVGYTAFHHIKRLKAKSKNKK